MVLLLHRVVLLLHLICEDCGNVFDEYVRHVWFGWVYITCTVLKRTNVDTNNTSHIPTCVKPFCITVGYFNEKKSLVLLKLMTTLYTFPPALSCASSDSCVWWVLQTMHKTFVRGPAVQLGPKVYVCNFISQGVTIDFSKIIVVPSWVPYCSMCCNLEFSCMVIKIIFI